MEAGLKISVVDHELEYLGIDIRAWNARFAGTAFIYARNGQLGEFASFIAGFPGRAGDERIYEFGTRDPEYTGGYCRLVFRAGDLGRSAIDVEIEDLSPRFSSGVASGFSVPIEAAEVDRFVRSLQHLDATRAGSAVLGPSD